MKKIKKIYLLVMNSIFKNDVFSSCLDFVTVSIGTWVMIPSLVKPLKHYTKWIENRQINEKKADLFYSCERTQYTYGENQIVRL